MAARWLGVAFGGAGSDLLGRVSFGDHLTDPVIDFDTSAGAMSVSSHLLAYSATSTSLFRAGILQSGGPTTENYRSINDTKTSFDSILLAAGCSNASDANPLACLRGLSAEKFNSSIAGTSWMPSIDGGIVPTWPSEQLAQGKFVQVPLLVGGEPSIPRSLARRACIESLRPCNDILMHPLSLS